MKNISFPKGPLSKKDGGLFALPKIEVDFMREFASEFYHSKRWLKTRDYIRAKHFGLCERCGKPGDIVHHKVYLTPNNINDISITLGEDNLELLCQDCHNKEHMKTDTACVSGFMFDERGDLVRAPR